MQRELLGTVPWRKPVAVLLGMSGLVVGQLCHPCISNIWHIKDRELGHANLQPEELVHGVHVRHYQESI